MAFYWEMEAMQILFYITLSYSRLSLDDGSQQIHRRIPTNSVFMTNYVRKICLTLG